MKFVSVQQHQVSKRLQGFGRSISSTSGGGNTTSKSTIPFNNYQNYGTMELWTGLTVTESKALRGLSLCFVSFAHGPSLHFILVLPVLQTSSVLQASSPKLNSTLNCPVPPHNFPDLPGSSHLQHIPHIQIFEEVEEVFPLQPVLCENKRTRGYLHQQVKVLMLRIRRSEILGNCNGNGFFFFFNFKRKKNK